MASGTLAVPRAAGRDVAAVLALWSEEYLRSQGAVRVTALVAFDDAAAGGFWDAAGYPQGEEIGRRVRDS